MAKGHRGNTQKATPNGPDKAKNNKAADKENYTDTQNPRMSKSGNRNFDKAEEHKPEIAEETNPSQIANDGQRKDAAPGVPSKVQPTTEQLMIAKLIQGHSDDPHQQKKIQQVIDVTGKPEDEVATALFDAGWDENKAVELLLEDGDHLSAWEETGKKKKSKKTTVEDNDGFGDGNDASGFQDPREKGSRQRGPPRMQHRGRGGGSQTKGDRNGGRDGGGGFTENGDRGDSGRGRGRRRDQPPRRGGRGGAGRGGGEGGRGGGRDFSSRQQSNGGSSPGRTNSDDVVGFQGSIDTWANPNEQKSSDNSNSQDHKGSRDVRGSTGAGEGGGGSAGGPRGERPHCGGGHSGRGGGQSGKDPFDNAGNWGDDFPQAKDWDNEEYTGSLANTKVFTASGDRGTGPNQRTPANRSDQQTQQQQQPLPAASVTSQPQQQQQPVGAISQRGDYSTTALASKDPSISSTYPQSIDLSTLLQKPTTQSSVESSAVPGAQFNQQATEKLKAVIGIGQTSSNMSQQAATVQQQMPPTQDPNSSALYSHAQASDFNSIKGQPLQPKGHAAPGGDRTGSRMQPPSSSKAPAVEMPGDSLGRLDVQFGGLDLQFGGSGSANSDAMTKSSGFEFGSASVQTQQDPHKTGSSAVITKPVTDSFAPTAKEVNKTLSNALSSGGKLNPMAGSTVQVAGAVANQSNQQDSFSKSSSSAMAPAGSVPSVTPGRSGVGGGNSGTGGGTSFNKQGQSDNQGLSGYSGYNNYNKAGAGGSYGNSYQQQYQQYPNSNSFSSQQQQGSAGQSATSSSQYKGTGQYDKYVDPSLNNPSAAAALGLANTNTTNALSGKVSATTASKVNMPNLPPGVASMLHPQYLAAAGLAPAAAFYGLQQPMYGAYGNTGLGDLAAMPTTGYYDPNNHFAPTTLGATVGNRDLGNTNLANLNSLMAGSTSSSTGGNSGNSTAAVPTTLGSTSGFRSASATSTAAASATATATAVNSMAADSTSSPGHAASTGGSTGQAGSGGTGNTGVGQQHHSVQQQAQQQQQQQQFNLAATNAFAAQQMPAGYAYYFGAQMGNMGHLQQAYGATTPGGHVQYQPTAMTVPGAGAPASQFQQQKSYGQTSYGSGYDTLSQQAVAAAGGAGNKDFSSNYPSNGQSKSTGGSAVGGTGNKGAHQYWGNTLTGGTQLW